MSKTNKIHRLPDELVNIIAAGEVVERPASALKEMLENSIDSSADNIKVIVKDGGVKEITVVDNGAGIDIDDAELVLERSATSKITSEEDLENLYTYGFRGEALASISSISDTTQIASSTKDTGFRLFKSAGNQEIKASEERGKGTSISVFKLLEKVPARKKFLKSTSTELKHLKDTFIYSAIPHTNVHFELFSDEKLIFRLPKTQDIFYRLYEIFGNPITKDLLKNSGGSTKIQIKGFIGKPSLGKKSSKHQYIFINNRYVKSPLIHSAISQAFSGRMHRDFKPVYFIFLDLDPVNFDINVHPRKLEVKFSNEQEIFKSVFAFTQKTLQKNEEENLKNLVEDQNELDMQKPTFLRDEPKEKSIAKPFIKNSNNQSRVKTSIKFTKTAFKDLKPAERPTQLITPTDKDNRETFHRDYEQKQLLNSFIFVEQGESIILIDQEAASKHIFKNMIDRNEVQKDRLSPPVVIDLDKSKNKERLIELSEKISESGIDIEDLGDSTIQVLSKPKILPKRVLKELLNDIAISKEITQNVVEEKIVDYSSYKKGEALTSDEIELISHRVSSLNKSSFIKLDKTSIESLIKKNR